MNSTFRKKTILMGTLCMLLTGMVFSPACPVGACPVRASGMASGDIQSASTQGRWVNATAMHYARGKHTATLLNSGKVLVFGGYPGDYTGLIDPELYDPATDSWSFASAKSGGGAVLTNFYHHTATLLKTGQVLMVGGETYATANAVDAVQSYLKGVELYDPISNTWTIQNHTIDFRVNHTATLLPSGKVLVAGGDTGDEYHTSLSSAEI